MLTNLANFDPVGKFMEQITGKCARSAQKKIQEGTNVSVEGGQTQNFCYWGAGLDGGGTVGEHIAPISSKTPLVLPALYAFLAA